jgi:hypothetical protein
MDIVPHPETGKIAVLAACGSEIRLFGFGTDSAPEGAVLFEHTSSLSEGEWPYRFVMVFERQGESLFFLPSPEAIELRTWTGELRERITPEQRDGVERFEEVKGSPDSSHRLGGPESITFSVRRDAGNEPPFIAEQDEAAFAFEGHSPSMMWGQFDVLRAAPEEWPWFTLQPGIENSPRVRCANRSNPGETHIRIDRALSDNRGIGPARKYPGMITRLNAELPDFNGDGYTDLLLWNTDRPSVSVSTIARMAVQQDWPIRLTAHVYDPESGRYTAKPFASMDVRATWDMLLRRGFSTPLAAWVVDDLNADGRTDVAFTADDRTYTLWMMGKEGPRVEEVKTRDPIEGVSFAEPLDESGRITIGLRTESTLYLIDAE